MLDGLEPLNYCEAVGGELLGDGGLLHLMWTGVVYYTGGELRGCLTCVLAPVCFVYSNVGSIVSTFLGSPGFSYG